MRIYFLTIFTAVLSLPVLAAPLMCRAVSVDARAAITLSCNGKQETLTLAGIEMTDRFSAAELLRWTIVGSWVMVERSEAGAQIYRSPDGMFVNRELVLRGYARATAPGIEPEPSTQAVYLGEVDPGPRSTSTKSTRSDSRAPRRAPAPRATTPRRPSRRGAR